METPSLCAMELAEKRFITFVIYHTRSFEEALEYLTIKSTTTLHERRERYNIAAPARAYAGPKLTQEQMEEAYRASLTAVPQVLSREQQKVWLHSSSITITVYGLPPSTYQFSQLVTLQPEFPLPTGARLTQ